MKKILITGATGFLGTALTSYFTEKGVEVVSLSRLPAKTRQAESRTQQQTTASHGIM